MKTPKRIKTLLDRKQAFIDAARDKMDRYVVKIQAQLLDKIISDIIPNLDVKSGIIQDTAQNYRILSDFDRVYGDFMKQVVPSVGKQVATVTGEIATMGESYFRMVLTEDLGKRFDKVISGTTDLMNARIGLKGEKTISGGFLESIFKSGEISTKAKDYIAKSITGQIDQKEFLSGLSEIVNGKEGSMGALEKQYQRYGYDLYQQYDRAYNKNLAEQFELDYFIYEGTLVGESRDFCVAHAGKVYSKEEAEEWREWTPSKGEYPPDYEIQQKDIYSVPSYMSYPGYNPLVDCGGYRCRHKIAYIPQELAEEMRPELKNNPDKTNQDQQVQTEENEFIESSTIKEAEAYADSIGINATYSGLSVVDANMINKLYTKIQKDFNLKGITIKGGAHNAMARANGNEIRFHKESFSSQRSVQNTLSHYVTEHKANCLKMIETNTKYYGADSPKVRQWIEAGNYQRYLASPSTIEGYKESVMIHETGHVVSDQTMGMINRKLMLPQFREIQELGGGYKLHNPTKATQTFIDDFGELWSKYKKSDDRYNISTYGMSNHKEFFAETFTMYYTEPNTMPKDIFNFFEKLKDHAKKTTVQ